MPSRAIPSLKAVVHVLCLLPLLYLLWMYTSGALANFDDPIKHVMHFTGKWALWILFADLAITPVRRLHPSLAWMIRFRRMVGLYAFFYATLHLLTYVFLFSGYDAQAAVAGLRAHHLAEPWRQLKLIAPSMLDDLQKKKFMQVGLLTWFILLALAVTSPQRVLLAMGGKNWQRLHRLIYVAVFAAVVHVMWQVKAGHQPPWIDVILLWVLLLARVFYAVMKWWRGRSKRSVEGDGLKPVH